MADTVDKQVKEHGARLEGHEAKLKDHAMQLSELRESRDRAQGLLEQHDRDIQDLKVLQATMATRDDVHEVSEKIDLSVNGLLRDALHAVPAEHANQIRQEGIAEKKKANKWLIGAAWSGVVISVLTLIYAAHTGHAVR